MAESDAWLTPDGQFCHTLSNKHSLPVTIPHDTVWLRHDSMVYVERPSAAQLDPKLASAASPTLRQRLYDLISNILMLTGLVAIPIFAVRILRRRFIL